MTVAEQSAKYLRSLRQRLGTEDQYDELECKLAERMTQHFTPLVAECFDAIRVLRKEITRLREYNDQEFWLTRNRIRIEVATVMIELFDGAITPAPVEKHQ